MQCAESQLYFIRAASSCCNLGEHMHVISACRKYILTILVLVRAVGRQR